MSHFNFNKKYLIPIVAIIIGLIIGTVTVINSRKTNEKKTTVVEKKKESKKKETGATPVVKKREVIKKDRKVVFLTIDDGPSLNTAKCLEVLKRYNVKATFYVTGLNPKYRHYIKEAYQQGHTIAAHSYSHKYSQIYKSTDAFFEDIEKLQKLIQEQTGQRSNLIRFAGGSSNKISAKYSKGIMTKLVKEVEKRGYTYQDWNVDSTDAAKNVNSVENIIRNSKSHVKQAVILMHDAPAKVTTPQALPSIIEYYKKNGYEFKTFGEAEFTCYHHPINN